MVISRSRSSVRLWASIGSGSAGRRGIDLHGVVHARITTQTISTPLGRRVKGSQSPVRLLLTVVRKAGQGGFMSTLIKNGGPDLAWPAPGTRKGNSFVEDGAYSQRNKDFIAVRKKMWEGLCRLNQLKVG